MSYHRSQWIHSKTAGCKTNIHGSGISHTDSTDYNSLCVELLKVQIYLQADKMSSRPMLLRAQDHQDLQNKMNELEIILFKAAHPKDPMVNRLQ